MNSSSSKKSKDFASNENSGDDVKLQNPWWNYTANPVDWNHEFKHSKLTSVYWPAEHWAHQLLENPFAGGRDEGREILISYLMNDILENIFHFSSDDTYFKSDQS